MLDFLFLLDWDSDIWLNCLNVRFVYLNRVHSFLLDWEKIRISDRLWMLHLYTGSSTWCILFCIRLGKWYLIVSLEMLDLYSSTWYVQPAFVSVRLRQLHLILLLARFVYYFPLITQSIKGIDRKAWQFKSVICEIYTATTVNLTDITSPRLAYFSWFDQILWPHGGDPKFFWKVKCLTYAQGPPPPLGLNIDRCITRAFFCMKQKNCATQGIKQLPYNPTSKNSEEIGYFEVSFLPFKTAMNTGQIIHDNFLTSIRTWKYYAWLLSNRCSTNTNFAQIMS